MRRAVFVLVLLIGTFAVGEVRELHQTFKDSAGQQIRCDIYIPSTDGKHPAVLILHGGAGFTIRAADWAKYANSLAERGYVAVVPHYFDATGSTTMDQLDAVKAKKWIATVHDAITFAGQLDGVDSRRIGLIGFSLGSFIALAEAPRDKRVRVIVEYYGGLNDLVGGGDGQLPPTLILHGDKDTTVPIDAAYKLKAKLEAQKVAYEMKIYPGAGHAFDASDPKDAWERAVAFLDRYLRAD